MYRYISDGIAVLVFFVVARVKLICKVEYKKGGQDHIAQNEPHCQPPSWRTVS